MFLDITASHEQRPIILDVVAKTAAVAFMPLTVGGGIRSVEDIRALLSAGADCAVRAPRQASLKIRQIGGDARLKSLEGPAEIQNTGGSLVLRQTGPLLISHVGGDMSAKKVRGALEIKNAGGNVSARSVSGDFSSENIGGDLYLRDVSATARARSVSGDVTLNIAFNPGEGYEFQAEGDIRCRIRPGQHARLTIQSGGAIEVEAPGAKVEGDARQKVVTLG